MASQESLDRVQQLYVAYYGRPADQEGLEYWAGRVDEEGESAIINAFGNSEEYAALAEGQGNATLVNSVYLQAFDRNADPEGLAYYTGVLERGEKSLAEIATTIINAAGGIDKQTFDARVKAAAEYTAEFGGDDYDLEAAKAAIEAAKPGVDASALTEALTTLKDAQTAEADFLEGLVENEVINGLIKDAGGIDVVSDDGTTPDDRSITKLSEDLSQAQISEAIEDVYAYAAGQVNTALNLSTAVFLNNQDLTDAAVDLSVTGLGDRSTAVQNQLIADGVEAAQKLVTIAEKEAEDGVIGAMATVEQRLGTLETRLESEYEIQEDFVGELGRFDALNGITTTVPARPVVDPASTLSLDSGAIVLTFQANGTWAVTTGADVVDSYEGIDALLAAGNAYGEAVVATNTAEASVLTAANSAIELQTDVAGTLTSSEIAKSETDGDYDVSITFSNDALDNILEARQSLSTLEDAAADLQAIRDIRDEAESLSDDVDDAVEAIEDEDDGFGINVVTVENGAESGTDGLSTGDDVYVFNAEDADANGDIALDGFGLSGGEDLIFFGEEYSFVELTSDQAAKLTAGTPDFSADLGSASDLEIFWTQSGANVELFVETKAFAGNGTTNGDFVQVSLTGGVNSDNIDFANGYLTAGEPA